jgi:hypothetical protein
MIRPDPQIVKTMATVARQYPELVQYIGSWYEHELTQLPNAVNNPALSQGRCQVLGELYRFAKDAPETAANIKPTN